MHKAIQNPPLGIHKSVSLLYMYALLKILHLTVTTDNYREGKWGIIGNSYFIHFQYATSLSPSCLIQTINGCSVWSNKKAIAFFLRLSIIAPEWINAFQHMVMFNHFWQEFGMFPSYPLNTKIFKVVSQPVTVANMNHQLISYTLYLSLSVWVKLNAVCIGMVLSSQ